MNVFVQGIKRKFKQVDANVLVTADSFNANLAYWVVVHAFKLSVDLFSKPTLQKK